MRSYTINNTTFSGFKSGLNLSINPNKGIDALKQNQGYEVDKEGYFTSEFNKKARITEDIRIHSSTNFVKAQNNGSLKSYANIDIETIGNVYKIVSQLVQKTPKLKGKSSFSKEDLANYFPQDYLIDRHTLELKQTFSYEQMKSIMAKGGFNSTNENEKLSPSFFNLYR